MKKLTLSLVAFAVVSLANAQPVQNNGDNSSGSLQNIGDVDNTKSASTSTQVNPSANQNGNSLGNTTDTRTQINPSITSSINPNTSSNALGANLALGNDSNAKANASNGNQSLDGRSQVGNVGSASGGNTMTGGDNTAKGGTASSNGTLTGTNAIKDSGNSTTKLTDVGNAAATGGTAGAVAAGGKSDSTSAGGTAATNATVKGTNEQGQTQANRSNNAQDTKQATSTAVDASDRSTTRYDSRALALPTVVPPTPMTILPSSTIASVGSNCGVMQQVVRTPIETTFHGIIFDSKKSEGFTDDLAPYMELNGRPYKIVPGQEIDPRAEIVPYLMLGALYVNNVEVRKAEPFGHEVIDGKAVLSVGGARNFAIGGGGGSNQNWGQGGGGASGSSQQIGERIQLRLCRIDVKPQVVNNYTTINNPPALPVVAAPGQ